MSMFCFQCQEAAHGTGCTKAGVCGKTDVVAGYQDLLIFATKGLAWVAVKADQNQISVEGVDRQIVDALFTTITNANFDGDAILHKVHHILASKRILQKKLKEAGLELNPAEMPEAAAWNALSFDEYKRKAPNTGVLNTENEDIRSLRELEIYGLKGMAAYAEHAMNLGESDEDIHQFIRKALVATMDDSLDKDALIQWVMDTGAYGVKVMALLDKANTGRFGNPEITEVNIGVSNKPGILVSGHDLLDLEELLEQTKDSGVDIYTHSEMLPAHYYPVFKKYSHFIGNYGGAWWSQREEFEHFHGPILFTTNCIVPPPAKATYRSKIFTTGAAGLDGATHIPEREKGKHKDFSAIIEMAKSCDPPKAIEEGKIVGGFAHDQVMQLADKVVDAVKSGAIKQFFVMAGCDGRMKSREYYTDFAKALPQDTVILTAGCAKYRYNKLPLGDIGGIPRVLDAGQCNDSYSLAVIALKLKEVFQLNDINELPISYNIAWYEQKAVIVLLALLSLGVKNIKLGPSLPAFLSPNVAKVLVEAFNLSVPKDVTSDIEAFLG